MILLVNQLTIPLFLDIANASSKSFPKVVLFTGKVGGANAAPDPKLKLVASVAYNRTNLFFRLFSWIGFSVHLFSYLLARRAVSQVWVVTNPPLAPLVVRWLSRWKRFSYSVVVFDLYPDALLQTGLVSEKSWIYRKWTRLNAGLFSEARHVVTLSESMKQAVQRYLRQDRDIQVIPNWSDLNFFSPRPKSENEFVIRYELMDRFVVVYAGNLGMTHDLESLINAAKDLQDDVHFAFLIVGDGAKRSQLVTMATKLRLNNVKFLPVQPYRLLPLVLSAADVAVVTLGTGAEGISVPSKTYTYMAAGACLAAVAPDESELVRIIRHHGCGVAVRPGDAKGLADVLRQLRNNPSLLHGFRMRSREAAREYDGKQVDRYLHLMQVDNV